MLILIEAWFSKTATNLLFIQASAAAHGLQVLGFIPRLWMLVFQVMSLRIQVGVFGDLPIPDADAVLRVLYVTAACDILMDLVVVKEACCSRVSLLHLSLMPVVCKVACLSCMQLTPSPPLPARPLSLFPCLILSSCCAHHTVQFGNKDLTPSPLSLHPDVNT